jgi:glycosyltransferase involved in cell wall biosynthesis
VAASGPPSRRHKVLLFANSDWYLFNFRLPLARRLRDEGFEAVMVSPPGPYAARLSGAGLRWLPLAMDRRSLNPLRELGVVVRLARLYRRERPDLVHHFTLKSVVYGSIAAAMAAIPARIDAVAGLGWVFSSQSSKARLLRPLVRGLLRAALAGKRSRLILQNPSDVAVVGRLGLASTGHIRLIPGSGVDTSRFRPAAEPVLSGPTTRVVLASRLLWDKGIGEFVEAARILHAARLPIRCTIAGAPDPGNPASIPQAQLDAWAAEGIVELAGQVDDMVALLAASDIGVLPSYYGEGVPRSLIEAAACGLPLVTTDTPGCSEVVTHEVTGLIVPACDVDALAAAIRALHEDPARARRLGAAARRLAVRRFDEGIVISRTLEVYAELLPEDTGRSLTRGSWWRSSGGAFRGGTEAPPARRAP